MAGIDDGFDTDLERPFNAAFQEEIVCERRGRGTPYASQLPHRVPDDLYLSRYNAINIHNHRILLHADQVNPHAGTAAHP